MNHKPDKQMFQEAVNLLCRLKQQIESVIIGKPEAVELALTALLARGHILLDDLPGTGKTTLAKTIARSLGCHFSRIQFTPDLMPSDVTGMNYYNPKTGEFEFRSGPILTNILLADEINRATPRTQSALLEAMEEKQVTVDGQTRVLERPFLVMATQNPIDSEGTFALPFAQQDRFMLKIRLGYPHRTDEAIILNRHGFDEPLSAINPVINSSQIIGIQEMVGQVYLEDSLIQYILNFVEATRRLDTLELALSTRASLAMFRAAKALALQRGRDYVLPDDLKLLCLPLFAHRLKLKSSESYKGAKIEDLLQKLLQDTPLPLTNGQP